MFLVSSGAAADARQPWRVGLAPFDSAMTAVLAEGYPGGSLAVIRDGRLVYARGYGLADEYSAATPFTRYRQASISKADGIASFEPRRARHPERRSSRAAVSRSRSGRPSRHSH